jgi:predicted transcriptional regulator
MNMPQEIEVWYLLPSIRKELVSEMFKRGLKQREIAKKLEISDSSVSLYQSKKRGEDIKFSEKVKNKITKSVDRILQGGSVTKELINICELAKKELVLCGLHKKYGDVKGKCEICLR